MKDEITQALLTLSERTGKEWIHLKDIYKEVETIRGKPNANKGASIRRTLEEHTQGFDAFKGKELYISKGKGTGLYKSKFYNEFNKINTMKIGETFTRDQLMRIFKISGQSGMMKTNTLNALVLTTSEDNGIYDDSRIENGIIQYTGEGQTGDQQITKNNKTLYESRETGIPVYLFSKDDRRRYTFEGRVELYNDPYQLPEKDINGNERLVWKFPLRVIEQEHVEKDEIVEKISYEIIEIENKISDEMLIDYDEIRIIDEPLKLRKYRRTGKHVQRTNKPDYIAQEIVKTTQGVINEKYIYELELKRLFDEEAEEQTKLMEEFFNSKKENEGFDILSFEKNESGEYVEKYIEVKSTKGNEGTPIDITMDEIEFAKDHIDNYYLYRIINSDSDQRYLKIVKGKELLEEFNFVPVAFKIYAK